MAQRRTDSDRLASVLQLYRASQNLPRGERMTMREVADELGISTRTLRRIKNEPGHVLAPRTRERMHKPLVSMTRTVQRAYKRTLRDAGVPMVETKTPIILLPAVKKSRDKRTTTLNYTVEGLSAQQIAQAAYSNIQTGGFNAWRVKVRVPVGVSLSGAVALEGPKSIAEDSYYMAGPFDPRETTLADIQSVVDFHMNAGRFVAEIDFSRDE